MTAKLRVKLWDIEFKNLKEDRKRIMFIGIDAFKVKY
jgi:hypothetical protein